MRTQVACAAAFFAFGAIEVVAAIDPPKWSTPKAETGAQLATDIDGYLLELEKRGFSGILLVTEDGEDLLHKAYGLADRESGRRMTVDTGSCIGSIVKPITKAAIVKLESEGKLGLDDKLPKFLDNVPPDKAEITLQQVIDHKAGFPDIFGDDYDLVSKEWVLEQVMKAPLIGKPGEKEEYSNCGYSVLGAVIEKVSGMPYEKYVSAEILTPAGTPRIGYVLPGWKNEELAVGYQKGQRWGTSLDHAWMADGPGWNLRCNGGMLATVRDLHRWYDAVLSGKVMNSEGTKRYADMTIRKHNSGLRMVGSVGGNGITNSIYVNFVDKRFVFVMFTNVDEFESEFVFKEMRSRILDYVNSKP